MKSKCALLAIALAALAQAAVRVDGVDDRAMGVALDGKKLYCIAGRSLYALDVADPLVPKVIGRLDGMDNRRQVAVADGFEKLGELPGGRRVTDCCFVGDRLVTAEGLAGWAVYALDGPTGFREVARRPTTALATVAFWCWPAGTKHAVLSPRNGSYCVVGFDDFTRPDPFCKLHVTCLWDKYLPDAQSGCKTAPSLIYSPHGLTEKEHERWN